MKRSMFLVAALAMVGVGCDDTSAPVFHPDLSVKVQPDGGAVDLSIGGSPIGGDCTKQSDCLTGTSPGCVINTHMTGSTGTCAADCTTDADCGALATCITFSNGSQCVKSCTAATDCPTGMACYVGLGCYPTDNPGLELNCDPTVAACTTTTVKSGGCIRQAVGTGMTGQCASTCDIGVKTCPPSGTNPQHCIVLNMTADGMGGMTGDLWNGAVCQGTAPAADQNADGTECAVMQGGQTDHFIDACVDGDECDSVMTTANATPDNKCHKLCYQPATTAGLDAGTVIPDGGVIAMACPGGTTCKDIFGLFGTNQPIGVCE